MKKIIKIYISVFIATIILTGSIIFAYYYISDAGQEINTSTDITSDNTIEVSSFPSFIENATDSKYNDYEIKSESSRRTIIKLTENITLTSSLVINKDIHLDLNGKTLNLNGYTLTLKHGYAGCFTMYNGNIERGLNSEGQIELDLPYAGFESTLVTYTSNLIATTEALTVSIIHLDAKYTAYSALYAVGLAISADLAERPTFLSYNSVSAITTLTPELFISRKTCAYNDNSLEACTFVYDDLVLPTHYLSTDVEINYTSSDESILNNNGVLGTAYGDVDFEVKIERTGWEDIAVTFKLHVVNLADSETKANVSLAMIKNYLSKYYVDSALVVKEEVILPDYYYKFDHAIELPATALGGNISYTYSTSNLSGVVNSNAVIYKNANNDDAYIFEPSISDYHLIITCGGISTPLNMYSTYVGLEETIAYLIANQLYGGSIVYDKASVSKELISLSDITESSNDSYLADLKDYITSYNITNISYSLKGEVSSHYQINSDLLSLQEGALPGDKESAITMTITFGTTDYNIDLFIEYLDSSGSTLSSYLTYYSIYNAGVPSELETNFIMPLATNNRAPYSCYDVASYTTERIGSGDTAYTKVTPTLNKPVNLKVALWYDGAEKLVFTYNTANPQSFTTMLDAYLSTNNITLQQIAAKTGTNAAYYKFSIDAQNSLNENSKLVLIYNYKFESSASSWSRYEHTNGDLTDNNTTYFTTLGGLFYNTNGRNSSGVSVDHAVRDANFFVWIYNRFRPNIAGYEDITTATSDLIIPIDWLGQEMIITKDDSELSSVTDFSGIKYLKSVTEVDLSGGTVSTNVLNGISEMKSLKKLILSNCNLTDISALSRLAAQNTLKVLDISNNSIQYFDSITTISSLEKVYLYNNNATNDYYGSKGICNFQAFADLMLNGSSVYNDISNEVPILYAESNNLDDYRRLKEIAYQEKLLSGLDIRNLYTNFIKVGTTITNVTGNGRPGNNPFGLKTAGTLSWGYQGDSYEGTKYLISDVITGEAITANTYYEQVNGEYQLTTDTTFGAAKNYYVLCTYSNATYFYVKLTYSNNNVLIVKYYVDRY